MLFSVIIPAKNEEKRIALCFAALEKQTLARELYEIIMVDNGSSDNTVGLAEEWGVKVLVRPDLSLSGLRNFGAATASGELLAFLDADCIPEADWLQNAASAFIDDSVGCTGSTPVAPTDGTWVERIWSSFRTRRTHRCHTSWINSSNFIVRRRLFDAVEGFNENVKTCEDVDICMRLHGRCTVLFDPSVRVVHLGEPKTVKAFFLKEIWRGKGTFSGLLSHGLRLSELQSLSIPLYYIVITACCAVAVLQQDLGIFFVVVAMLLLPSLTFALWLVSKTGRLQYFFGYSFLFLVYAYARTYALFLPESAGTVQPLQPYKGGCHVDQP